MSDHRPYVVLKKSKEVEGEIMELIGHIHARDHNHAKKKAENQESLRLGDQIVVIPHSSFHMFGY